MLMREKDNDRVLEKILKDAQNLLKRAYYMRSGTIKRTKTKQNCNYNL